MANSMIATFRRLFYAPVALALAMVLAATPAFAQVSGIRDAEIERLLRSYTDPILVAAGLDPKGVKIYILNDPTLNAFVSNGQNIYIHTGLIMELDTPNQLIGVIAHETGHIAGGHLVRRRDAMEDAAVPIIVSMLAGVAAIFAGAPDLGMGLITGGQHVATRSILSFTRAQESSADQAGLSFLNATCQSGRGMTAVFERFNEQELMTARRQDPYARTHPMSRDRLAALERGVESSPCVNKTDSPMALYQYEMMRAKLRGFIEKPEVTLRRYPPGVNSDAAHYARAIAYFKQPNFEKSMAEVDALLARYPDNPYFHELRGQIFVESARPTEGIPDYERAVALLPDEPLLRVSLAGAIVASEDQARMKDAKRELVLAMAQDNTNALGWRYLATAEERLGEHGLANLASAEMHFAIRNYPQAMQFARRAKGELTEGSIEMQRAVDIIAITTAQMQDDDGGREARR